MKRTRIVDSKYKGYIIKPTLSGFKVYRRGYFIGQYKSLAKVRTLIDHVVEKRGGNAKPKKDTTNPPEQLGLFS